MVKGVLTAELRLAEVHPCFKICLDPIAALQIKDTRAEFQSDQTKIGGVSLICDTSWFFLTWLSFSYDLTLGRYNFK